MRAITTMAFIFAFLLAAAGPAACLGAKETEGPEGLAALLPAAADIQGWKLDGEPLAYDAENLWEYINGSAENFLSFDFRRVIAQDYISGRGAALKAEIYEHGSPLMAYGIYAQMRSPGLAIRRIGNEAFADEYSINFWKGNYYVRVAVFDTIGSLRKSLETFACAIAAKIEEAGTLPPEISAFPEEGLVPNDIRYLTQGVLGREKFPPAFLGSYKLGDEEAKLYIAPLPDSAAARDTFEWYTDQMESFQATAGGPDGGCILGIGVDRYQGKVLVFNFGKWLGVLTGLEGSAGRGEAIVRRAVERLAALNARRP